MKVKKSLESRIKGWFPKEPVFPSSSNPKRFVAEAKDEKQKENRRIGRIIYVTIVVGGILLGIFSAMGFGFHAAIAIGVAIPLVAAVAERRSKLPKKDLTQAQRKGAKMIAIANMAVGSLFISFYFLINPLIIKNDGVTLAFMIALFASWFLINRLLLRKYNKQMSTEEAII
jgi:hypothetical protein